MFPPKKLLHTQVGQRGRGEHGPGCHGSPGLLWHVQLPTLRGGGSDWLGHAGQGACSWHVVVFPGGMVPHGTPKIHENPMVYHVYHHFLT